MSSNARVFFAGVGTTFVILAVGFGTGLMMASSTLQELRESRFNFREACSCASDTACVC